MHGCRCEYCCFRIIKNIYLFTVNIRNNRKMYEKRDKTIKTLEWRTCVYQGVRSVSFSKITKYILNEWHPISQKKKSYPIFPSQNFEMLQKCRKVYIVRKGFTVPHPFTQHILHFCFPTLFSIQPCFKTFYTAPPIPLHSYQSITLIQHTNLPYTITLKISVSRNQTQPFKFLWNKPNKYCN